MSIYKYIVKSLVFYKKQHLAVFFAIVISTAVLSGALIVGDSVEYSLRNMVKMRLGKVNYALATGDRFVTIELANRISKFAMTSPVLMLQGISVNSNENKRINKTNVLGIDSSFWELSDIELFDISENEAVIGINTAEKLNLKIGDEFLLRIANAQIIPLDAPFASDENTDVAVRLKVKYIANNEQLARFSLKNDQKAPFNVFVDRIFISKKLEFADLVNLILVSEEETRVEELNRRIESSWRLADANLQIRDVNKSGDYELISDRIFIDNPISELISSLKEKKTKNLTYLVNSLKFHEKETPYSFVTASDAFAELKIGEIIVNQWLADDLGLTIGDSLNLKYFVINPLEKLFEEDQFFLVKSIISNENILIDSLLMPSFPGMSDAGNCRDWETGIPIDLKKIRDKDEAYWNDFHGKPKAVISLDAGLEIWSNQFGNYTNIRFNEKDISKADLEKKILSELKPKDLNIQFVSVREKGERAVDNGVDFGGLFLSLSFFVIAAAVLLLIIIFKLNTEARTKELGILTSLGFSKKQILKIKLGESLFVAALGGLFGTFVGIYYNNLLLIGLNSVWYDAVKTNMLRVYILPNTLLIGAFIGFVIAAMVIYFVTKNKLKKTIVGQIANLKIKKTTKNAFSLKIFFILSLLSGILLISYIFTLPLEKNAGLFLASGGLVLITLVLGFSVLLSSNFAKVLNFGKVKLNFSSLALKNISSNKSRSISIVVLLALGTFTIIVTASNRKTFLANDNVSSGTGGYLFWAETTMPLLHNLNTKEGQTEYNFDENTFKGLEFLQFHKLEGDDASCLNLNQVSNPGILGVNTKKLHSRGAFSFAQFISEEENKWLALEKDYGENVIPAIADQTVITWGLMKSVGDTLTYFNEAGKELKLLLIGGLKGSVFQGSILISDSVFVANFPSVSGSKIMLVDGDIENKKAIEENLNSNLIDYGIELSETNVRLAEFYSVTNTYLTVFLILGSLGVLIATLGMGVVLLRTILERKHEFGLLLALGFSKKRIHFLLLAENTILLVLGIFIGILSAFIGVLPSILTDAFSSSWSFVFSTIFIVFINGLFWIYLASKNVIKGNLIGNLASE